MGGFQRYYFSVERPIKGLTMKGFWKGILFSLTIENLQKNVSTLKKVYKDPTFIESI